MVLFQDISRHGKIKTKSISVEQQCYMKLIFKIVPVWYRIGRDHSEQTST